MIPPTQALAMYWAYRRKFNLRQIAARHGVVISTVRKMILRCGGKMRRRGRPEL